MLHRADAAIVITNDENARPVSGARVLASGHPFPTRAARRRDVR